MTRTLGPVDRIRWMLACTAAVTVALVATIGLLVGNGQAPVLQLEPSSAALTTGSSSPLDPRIAKLAARHPGALVQAIVQFKAGVSLARARQDVASAHGKVFAELHIINALGVNLTASRARWLAANRDVHAVSLNAQVTSEGGPGGFRGGSGVRSHDIATLNLRTTYDQTLNVPGLWREGITGAGVGVAVIDTGIDGYLPDFQSSDGRGSRVIDATATNSNATNATDEYGHGTDVAGIVAGNGDERSPYDPLRGRYIGVAPEANLISIKASDDNGNATVLNVIEGLQFAVDHQAQFNIRVVNMSLDSRTPQSYTTDPLDAAVESAWIHGIVVVVAAGNRGNAANAVQFAPANDPYVITVGGVDENGSANPANDTIASWSSRGITQDGFPKPDLYAPGVDITSVLAPGSVFATLCPTCIVGGSYIRTSGTSMATPMISGVVALLLQAHPNWTPDQIKGALTDPSVASNPSLHEVDAGSADALQNPPSADRGLSPNSLVNGSTGNVTYSQSSWSQSSWSTSSWSTYFGQN